MNNQNSPNEIELPSLYPLQQAILDHPSRFKVLACGRRWGKTTLDVYILAQRVLRGETWGYFSVTYKNLAETYRELRNLLAPVTTRASQTEGRIEVKGGGLLEFWSLPTASKDTARGRKYHGLVVDEAAFIPNGEYVWNAVIRPTLADERGFALITSTPNGRNHFFQWFNRALDKHKYPDWFSWSYPTSTNPRIAPEELAAIENETPELYFKQEYLAVFLENSGAVFRRINECASLIPVVSSEGFVASQTEPIEGRRYCFGVDWAQKFDYTVITVMDMETKQLVAFDHFNGIDWSLQRGRLAALAAKWKPESIIAESNSIGSPNIEALQSEGLPVRSFETTANSKPPLIESLVLAFERGEIAIIDDPLLKSELMAYERKVNPITGRSQYSAPVGMHDDCVMALALAWHGCTVGYLAMPIFFG